MLLILSSPGIGASASAALSLEGEGLVGDLTDAAAAGMCPSTCLRCECKYRVLSQVPKEEYPMLLPSVVP